MEEAPIATLQTDQAAPSIPRKPVTNGYLPVQTGSDPKDSEGDEEKAVTNTNTPWFRRWLAVLKPLFGWLTTLKRFGRWLAALPDRPWLPEITSLALACVAFAAIVVTLAIHQGRPLPQWPHLISINSLIAIFNAIFKAALVMPVAEGIGQLKWDWFQTERKLIDLDRLDSASRGPWGSCCLLFTNYKHYLAFLGALVTIVALAIDPFSQQVIKYSNCLQAVTTLAASVAVANNYSRTNFGSLDLQMASAAYVGLINPSANASAAISFTCTTGNCTFFDSQDTSKAAYMSLAMCGECKNISNSIITKHVNQSGAQYNGYPLTYYSLPDSGLEIMEVTQGGIEQADSGEGRNIFDPAVSYASYDPTDDYTSLLYFDTIMFAGCVCDPAEEVDGDSEGVEGCNCEPLAARCEIFPCIKTYRAEVTNFVLDETEISSQNMVGGYDFTFPQKVLRDGEWLTCSNSTKPTSNHTVPVWTSGPNDMGGTYIYVQQECLFWFSPGVAGPLGNFLTWNSTSANSTLSAPFYDKLYNNGTATMDTLQSQVDGFVNTLTGVIRQYGEASEAIRPLGTTQRVETCIGVQWAWLSLPAALLVLTLAFLTITIWKTKSREVNLWKSSQLALLFHGTDQASKEPHGVLEEVGEMKSAARAIRARVNQQSGMWHLTTETVSKLSP